MYCTINITYRMIQTIIYGCTYKKNERFLKVVYKQISKKVKRKILIQTLTIY